MIPVCVTKGLFYLHLSKTRDLNIKYLQITKNINVCNSSNIQNQENVGPACSSSGAATGTCIRKDKPLIRRKSDLPRDQATQKAIEQHHRPDEFLVPPSNDDDNNQ